MDTKKYIDNELIENSTRLVRLRDGQLDMDMEMLTTPYIDAATEEESNRLRFFEKMLTDLIREQAHTPKPTELMLKELLAQFDKVFPGYRQSISSSLHKELLSMLRDRIDHIQGFI